MIDNLLCVELSSVCFRGWVVALVATPHKTPQCFQYYTYFCQHNSKIVPSSKLDCLSTELCVQLHCKSLKVNKSQENQEVVSRSRSLSQDRKSHERLRSLRMIYYTSFLQICGVPARSNRPSKAQKFQHGQEVPTTSSGSSKSGGSGKVKRSHKSLENPASSTATLQHLHRACACLKSKEIIMMAHRELSSRIYVVIFHNLQFDEF